MTINRTFLYLTLVLSMFCVVTNTYAAIYHASPENMTIQQAIDLAESGDTVIAAVGTYKGEGNVNIDFKGKNITVKSENGPEATIINCLGTQNTRGFIFQTEETNDAVLEGFTIKNGSHKLGGGIYCNNASPTIKGCIIVNNKAIKTERFTGYGGGIYGFNTDVKIIDCIISNSGSGGGLFFEGIVIKDGVVIRENVSKPNIIDCTISDNTGDGIFIHNRVGAVIKDAVITKNTGRGIVCTFMSRGGNEISNSLIEHNTSGGIACREYSVLRINGCIIRQNIGKYGGGIYCSPTAYIEVSDCIIAQNIATHSGGGMYITSTFGSSKTTNCTITRNVANERGGGVHVEMEGSYFTLSDSIVWGNSSNDSYPELFIGGNIAIVQRCDIRDGLVGINREPLENRFVYEDNIDKDPLFVDADRGDYRLKRHSPAIAMGAKSLQVGSLSVSSVGKKLVMWADLKQK